MSRPLIEISDVGTVTIVRFVDRSVIDMAVIDEVGVRLGTLVEELGRTNLLISFRGVDYVSSWMLGKLFTLHGNLKKVKGKLVLCEVSPRLLEVFEITGLIRIIPIVSDEATGLRAFE